MSQSQDANSNAAHTSRPILPETGFVRLPTVLKVFPVSKSTWWAGVAAGAYPKPVKLAPRTTAWCVEDIRLLIQQLGRGEA